MIGAFAALFGTVARWALPGGPAARLSIVIYHRVLARPDPLLADTPDVAAFHWQMQTLARHFRPLPLLEAVRRLYAGTLPDRAVCVTFDDGYADNAECALPVLRATGVPATFYVSTGYLDGGRMWNDTVFEVVRRLPVGRWQFDEVPGLMQPLDLGAAVSTRIAAAHAIIARIKYLAFAEREAVAARLAQRVGSLPDDLMMRSDQVRALSAAGMEIGAHTVGHPILARLAPADARAEIVEGRARLEALTGDSVRSFAYPNGKPGVDYLPEQVGLVRELGFECAVSTLAGVSDAATDPFQLRRFTPWDSGPARFALRLARNGRVAQGEAGC